MSKQIDVLVIGAGPAGSVSAAMVHKAGLSVRVVEREKFPRFVIGESLLPRCMEVLEDAEFLDAVKAKNFQQKFGAKFMKEDKVSDFNFSDQFSKGWTWTWQVQRAEFDLTLITDVQRRGVPVDFETTVTAIAFNEDESSVTTVEHKDGTTETIEARFIIDASGYGRVIPRLFNLDKPSNLDPRKAVFAHVQDVHRNNHDEPNRIIAVMYAPGVWSWIIPFSTGVTSLGFVGSFDYFNAMGGDQASQFRTFIDGNAYLKQRFGDVEWVFEPRKLEAWSATTDKFYGKGFVLTGNVTEFLDPIFSSGVMFATVSSHIASKMVIRKLKGENVDWDNDYTNFIRQGVDTFRTYVMAWYDGTLEKIFFSKNPDPEIKRQICSVLAGYVWDQDNAYVKDHAQSLKRLVKLIDIQERLDAL
ncbi:NAD(P)/FAD-dependent oxidoreductase [Chryseolinea lacunae]|uniref:Tryptophan 7-halogenase n=1 Tax=Chryseolinea lacunae TaxID=2801331 RepID=A0ABS1KPC0_9BACT|nr:NAD(P)/FAD-dependent oxidoreductase [Chryseolinea lacunae]MBL0741281.1 tryptophan 7-halogenase [Chryseolinea lacunae]